MKQPGHFASVSCAFAIMALVGPVGAQEAPRPDVRIGDEWHFAAYDAVPTSRPNRIWIVKSVRPDRIEATENGLPLLLTPDLNVLDSPRHAESAPGLLNFPLRTGKRWNYQSAWRFKAKGSSGTLAVDVEVVARERVAVPAGEFDAYKLLARGRLGGMSPSNTFYAGETTTTYWYAPAARAIVKSIHHNPYLGTTIVELVAMRRAR